MPCPGFDGGLRGYRLETVAVVEIVDELSRDVQSHICRDMAETKDWTKNFWSIG